MKYYATITHRFGQFEIGGTKESLICDMKTLKRLRRLDGSENICIYGVDLTTGSRIPVSTKDEDDILGAAV